MNTIKHNWHSWALFALGSLIGALLGLFVMREVTSAMAVKAPGFWFVSRAAAVVGYVLLWASTAWGVLISSKAVKELVPGPLAFTLHNVTAWLALGFSTLLDIGEKYLNNRKLSRILGACKRVKRTRVREGIEPGCSTEGQTTKD
jgi:hypothetical protein